MGYKKLDDIMELLTDELDGFNRSIDRLERLAKDTDNIKIEPDTTKIESMLLDHMEYHRKRTSMLEKSVDRLGDKVRRAELVPQWKSRLNLVLWAASILVIGYLSSAVWEIEDVRERAHKDGREGVMTSLRGYFDRYPVQYESYQQWKQEVDSTAGKK